MGRPAINTCGVEGRYFVELERVVFDDFLAQGTFSFVFDAFDVPSLVVGVGEFDLGKFVGIAGLMRQCRSHSTKYADIAFQLLDLIVKLASNGFFGAQFLLNLVS